MAGFQTAFNALPFIQQGVSLISRGLGAELAFQDSQDRNAQALNELQARQNAQLRAAEQNASLEKQRIALNAQESKRKRKAALKRAVSRQRVDFGAGGIASGAGGSSEAVLLGFFQESEAEKAERERLDNIRLTSIDQDLANQRRLNLIQRTQLQERQRIGRLSSGVRRFDEVTSFGSSLVDFGQTYF